MSNEKLGSGSYLYLIFLMLVAWCIQVQAKNCTRCNQPLVNGQCVTPGCPDNTATPPPVSSLQVLEPGAGSVAVTGDDVTPLIPHNLVCTEDTSTVTDSDSDEEEPKPKPPPAAKDKPQSQHSSGLTMDDLLEVIPPLNRGTFQNMLSRTPGNQNIDLALDIFMEFKDRLGFSTREQMVQQLRSVKQLKENLRAFYQVLNATPLTDEVLDPNSLSLQVTEIHSALGVQEKTIASYSPSFFDTFMQAYGIPAHNFMNRVGGQDDHSSEVIKCIHRELEQYQQVVVVFPFSDGWNMTLLLTPDTELNTGGVRRVQVSAAPFMTTVVMDIANIPHLLDLILGFEQSSPEIKRHITGIYAATSYTAL